VSQPVSLYGATKLASEIMAIEYGLTFDFPVWIDRCGVLAGAGQFGTAEQGIFSYWLHAHAARLRLRYIGFGGCGYQVRDAFHPEDLAALIALQLQRTPPPDPIYNAGGGAANAMSLAQLTQWCDERFGPHRPEPDTHPRPFDIPWLIMDSSRTRMDFGWTPERDLGSILVEIAAHVHDNPGWLQRSGAL
jgi:CDP-paratose 2-epimerase